MMDNKNMNEEYDENSDAFTDSDDTEDPEA